MDSRTVVTNSLRVIFQEFFLIMQLVLVHKIIVYEKYFYSRSFKGNSITALAAFTIFANAQSIAVNTTGNSADGSAYSNVLEDYFIAYKNNEWFEASLMNFVFTVVPFQLKMVFKNI